ncbi:hypothetical protein RCL1_000517 [Eukaryota sp. TZLM3-RCL]
MLLVLLISCVFISSTLSTNPLHNSIIRDYVSSSPAPPSFDFRSSHPSCVPPIKNQLSCNSDFAFSSTYALAARHCLRTGTLVSPSEMELISCSVSNGCEGGFLTHVSDYVSAQGLRSSSCYPFTQNPSSCQPNYCTEGLIGFHPVVWTHPTEYKFSVSNEWLKEELWLSGPIVVTIPLYHSFRFYSSGLYYPSVDEAIIGFTTVNLIGYDDISNTFTLSNSYGREWGLDGYFRISQNSNFSLGISVMAFDPDPELIPTDFFWFIVFGSVLGVVLAVFTCVKGIKKALR